MNITLEMVVAFVAIVGVLVTIISVFIGRFGRVDERIASVEKGLADHKVKAAENYVTIQALATFDERLARTEERVLAETRAVRSDISAMLVARPSRRRTASEVEPE